MIFSWNCSIRTQTNTVHVLSPFFRTAYSETVLCQCRSYLLWSPCCQWVLHTVRWWWTAGRPWGHSSCPRRCLPQSWLTVGTDSCRGGPGPRCFSLWRHHHYRGEDVKGKSECVIKLWCTWCRIYVILEGWNCSDFVVFMCFEVIRWE